MSPDLRLHPPLALTSIEDAPLEATLKGICASAVGHPLRELGKLNLSLISGDVPLPAAVLKRSALEHNAQWMRDFVERAGVSLCPHGKTTMAPQLFELQLSKGAWGITAATASHVRTYRRFGVKRILMANQLVGRANIDLVLDELNSDPEFDFYCLVDSLNGLNHLREHLSRRPIKRPLQVLLEVGARSGRTGVRTYDEGLALGRSIRDASPHIALRGVEAFEGIFGGDDEIKTGLAVHAMLETVTELTQAGKREGWFSPGEIIVSAGGSALFDWVSMLLKQWTSDSGVRPVLRSGCYLSHDALHYERMQARMRARSPELWGSGPGLRNAIEVWAQVQSVPEPNRLIVGMGRRDVSFDMELPWAMHWLRPSEHLAPLPMPPAHKVVGLYDQHAILESQAPTPLRVGDLLAFGLAHPCTTFDKWALLHLVDDDYRVTGGIRTFF